VALLKRFNAIFFPLEINKNRNLQFSGKSRSHIFQMLFTAEAFSRAAFTENFYNSQQYENDQWVGQVSYKCD
jgi:hypothetical protein